MLDENYMGHELVFVENGIKYIEDYICKKCNIKIWKDYKNVFYNVNGYYEHSKLFCDEIIIKNIIE